MRIGEADTHVDNGVEKPQRGLIGVASHTAMPLGMAKWLVN